MFKKYNHPTETQDIKPSTIRNFSNIRICVKNDMIPKSLQSHFYNRNRVYGQSNHKYHIPIANTELLKQIITYQGPKVWNYLKSELKNKESFSSFRRALK